MIFFHSSERVGEPYFATLQAKGMTVRHRSETATNIKQKIRLLCNNASQANMKLQRVIFLNELFI